MANPQIPDVSFIPQEWQVLYCKIGGNLMTEVQSINVVRTDGGADIATLARDYAGRVKGAAKADVTLRGVIPYLPPDTGGAAFSSGGMTVGAANGGNPGVQLDQTMLVQGNQNNNAPVKFLVQVGQPAAQVLSFSGFIHTFTVDVSTGKQADWTAQASGQFSFFTAP